MKNLLIIPLLFMTACSSAVDLKMFQSQDTSPPTIEAIRPGGSMKIVILLDEPGFVIAEATSITRTAISSIDDGGCEVTLSLQNSLKTAEKYTLSTAIRDEFFNSEH